MNSECKMAMLQSKTRLCKTRGPVRSPVLFHAPLIGPAYALARGGLACEYSTLQLPRSVRVQSIRVDARRKHMCPEVFYIGYLGRVVFAKPTCPLSL